MRLNYIQKKRALYCFQFKDDSVNFGLIRDQKYNCLCDFFYILSVANNVLVLG